MVSLVYQIDSPYKAHIANAETVLLQIFPVCSLLNLHVQNLCRRDQVSHTLEAWNSTSHFPAILKLKSKAGVWVGPRFLQANKCFLSLPVLSSLDFSRSSLYPLSHLPLCVCLCPSAPLLRTLIVLDKSPSQWLHVNVVTSTKTLFSTKSPIRGYYT